MRVIRGDSSIVNNIYSYDLFDSNNPNLIHSQVYNNIFTSLNSPSTHATAFTRNIFVNASTINTTNNGNTSVNNLFQTNPLFLNSSASNIHDNNYRLYAGSPGKNYGTDGSDVGFYGGEFPFVLLESGAMQLPTIRSLQVSGIVKQGGQVRVISTISNASNN